MKKIICLLMMAIGCWAVAETAQAPQNAKPEREQDNIEMESDERQRPPRPKDGKPMRESEDNPEMAPGGNQRPQPPKMGNRPHMPPKNPMLSAKMQQVILLMSKMKKENPKEYARLDELRRKNPRAFIAEIRKYLPKPKAMDRKHQILETECRELAAKIRATKDAAEKEKMNNQLRAKLKEQFELMLADATERVNKIQQQMKLLKENEEFIINERLEDMTKNQ